MTPISALTTIWDGLKYVMMVPGCQFFVKIKVPVTNSTHKRHKLKSKTMNKSLIYWHLRFRQITQLIWPANLLITVRKTKKNYKNTFSCQNNSLIDNVSSNSKHQSLVLSEPLHSVILVFSQPCFSEAQNFKHGPDLVKKTSKSSAQIWK